MKKLFLMMMLMAPLATFAQKFGKVNTQTIMQSLPEISKINGELEATAKQYENDLKSMQDELQRQSDAYDKGKSTMNATAQKQKEQELQQLYQKIQQTYQDNQQALQKAQQEKMQPVVAKVRNAITNVGNAGGFTYIFEEGAAVYTGSNVEDVTSKVQSELSKMK
ncbi:MULTISPECIES: OmpH family outer membrane protein [Prevotellaceae]|mgnify:CR=1 FL=1|uniref:Outer membrane protein n=2 Tax=Prevotellaceae TaxID=171552 RepID=F9D2T0_PREDD|nr:MULTISPECIES: OmpH family outer membrane protein [Prevotellaceae]AGB28610.1 outer membrane protein [Prevotella dentalis DSM 3688]EGQ15397.1 cationic outer membrane protein OmpH [Prevotella dentalis DSM 3688]